jgi:hypothetical protein
LSTPALQQHEETKNPPFKKLMQDREYKAYIEAERCRKMAEDAGENSSSYFDTQQFPPPHNGINHIGQKPKEFPAGLVAFIKAKSELMSQAYGGALLHVSAITTRPLLIPLVPLAPEPVLKLYRLLTNFLTAMTALLAGSKSSGDEVAKESSGDNGNKGAKRAASPPIDLDNEAASRGGGRRKKSSNGAPVQYSKCRCLSSADSVSLSEESVSFVASLCALLSADVNAVPTRLAEASAGEPASTGQPASTGEPIELEDSDDERDVIALAALAPQRRVASDVEQQVSADAKARISKLAEAGKFDDIKAALEDAAKKSALAKLSAAKAQRAEEAKKALDEKAAEERAEREVRVPLLTGMHSWVGH